MMIWVFWSGVALEVAEVLVTLTLVVVEPVWMVEFSGEVELLPVLVETLMVFLMVADAREGETSRSARSTKKMDLVDISGLLDHEWE